MPYGGEGVASTPPQASGRSCALLLLFVTWGPCVPVRLKDTRRSQVVTTFKHGYAVLLKIVHTARDMLLMLRPPPAIACRRLVQQQWSKLLRPAFGAVGGGHVPRTCTSTQDACAGCAIALCVLRQRVPACRRITSALMQMALALRVYARNPQQIGTLCPAIEHACLARHKQQQQGRRLRAISVVGHAARASHAPARRLMARPSVGNNEVRNSP